MSFERAVAAANTCLNDRNDIPGAPLWQIGKVRVFHSRESYELLQNTVDYLACKGRANRAFTSDEKEFMKELFEALWWGGQVQGYREAAALADHYVNGQGVTLKINADVYRSSVIVKDTMAALKSHIAEQVARKRNFSPLKSSDPGFLRSSFGSALQRGRNLNAQGSLLKNGCLLAEQSNQRLKNADNRFFLTVSTVREGAKGFFSTWKVDSIYDFEPFSVGYFTNIPLAEGYVLKLPDGLSHHLTTIGVASDFSYTASWTERWTG